METNLTTTEQKPYDAREKRSGVLGITLRVERLRSVAGAGIENEKHAFSLTLEEVSRGAWDADLAQISYLQISLLH